MKISIIIPTLNEEKKIGQCLDFLYPLADDDIDIIVVDTKETSDHTCRIVKSYDVTLIQSPISSRAYQMNLGAKNSKAEVLCFLHADVIPPKDFIYQIRKNMESFDYGWFSYRFDRSSWLLNINAFFTKYNGLFAGGGDQIQFLKRAVFTELKGFDEAYVLMEDFDLTRRLKRSQFKGSIVKKNAIVSTRKYENNSYLKVNLVNLYVFILFMRGVAPDRLKKVYVRYLK